MKNSKKTYKLIALFGLLFFCFNSIPDIYAQSTHYVANSVLSSGKWVKIQVTDNAIYKLFYEDIKNMGIADPSKVKIYGYGGWILNQDFTKTYIDDLPEVAVWMNKGSDGIFGAGDYLLFYGRGTVKWAYDTSTGEFRHENNHYSTAGYYFLTQGESGPKEMSLVFEEPANTTVCTTFDDYALHEVDSYTLSYSGRELFGERFQYNNTQTFNFTIPGITQDIGTARLNFVTNTFNSTPISMKINNVDVLNGTINRTGSEDAGAMFNRVTTWSGTKSEATKVEISLGATGIVSHLNYINLNMTRELKAYGNPYTFFRNKVNRSQNIEYNIAQTNDKYLVFKLGQGTTDQDCLVQTTYNSGVTSFKALAGSTIGEYALVDPSNQAFPKPTLVGEIPNQNLHSLQQLDMLIISATPFLSQAQRLADEHYNRSGLKVTVVDANLIYNEFSSGTPDATAYRRFMKMFYDRATNPDEKPKYLLFFGDVTYDNRFITTEWKNVNKKYYLLSYQSDESLSGSGSYVTDDYFGFLDDNEGANLTSAKLDIGIGRFPVNKETDAMAVVDKAIAYMNNPVKDVWKNKLCFLGGNGDNNIHMTQADSLAKYVERHYPEFMLTKVYFDAHKMETSNGRVLFPNAKNKFMQTLKNGCLLVDYVGHGGTSKWAADMVTMSDIAQMSFPYLPLWLTATCDFGRFDSYSSSGAEAVFVHPTSAGIALFTTTRIVYSDSNMQINEKLIENIFKKNNGKRLTLGDIMKNSKIAMGANTNNLKFALIGDPALVLNYPERKVELKTVNGNPVSEDSPIVLKAMENISFTGVILDINGEEDKSFNGRIKVTVFDSKQSITCLNQDKAPTAFKYTDYPNIIYSGNATVTNGEFTIKFMVPLDISYSNASGKINFYAWDNETNTEGQGAFLNYIVGGTADNLPVSENGPEIKNIYLNDPSFKNGDVVNSTPYFVADVYDDIGINMIGNNSGHDIIVVIDNSATLTYNLNSYFEPSESGIYGEGTVKFSIPTLPEGRHTLSFKVWNLMNNSTTTSIDFNVQSDLEPKIFNLAVAPNPAKERTTFVIYSDRPESQVTVDISVYDLAGRVLWRNTSSGSVDLAVPYTVNWDLVTDSGNKLRPGVYVYQATVKTSGGDNKTSKSKKLIVATQ